MYEFASSVINVWEKKIFDKLDQERMLNAPDKESAFLALFDADLGEFTSREENDAESILEKDWGRMKTNLEGILPENKKLIWFLFLKFDALNLKIALKKAFFRGKTAEVDWFSYAIEAGGEIERRITRFFNAMQGLKKETAVLFSPLNPFVEKMLDLSLEALRKVHLSEFDSIAIEKAVDESYFKVKLQIALAVSPLLEELARFEIDIANVKALLRSDGFISGGNMEREELEMALGLKTGGYYKGLDQFLESLSFSSIIRSFMMQKSELFLERDLQTFLSQRIFEKSRQTGSGVEKVMAFFQKKLNSHNNIRLILFAKANNISPEDIEKNLLPL